MSRMNKVLLSVLITIAATAAFTTSAYACGGVATMTCGYLDSVEQMRTPEGTTEFRIYGSFAWGLEWNTENSVQGTSKGFIHVSCADDETWCQQNLRNLLETEVTGQAFSTIEYSYGSFSSEAPAFVYTLEQRTTPMSSWLMPMVDEWSSQTFVCRAAKLLASTTEEKTFLPSDAIIELQSETFGPGPAPAFLSDRRKAILDRMELEPENAEGLQHIIDVIDEEISFGLLEGFLTEEDLAANDLPTDTAEFQGAGCSTNGSPMGTACWAGFLLAGLFLARRTARQ